MLKTFNYLMSYSVDIFKRPKEERGATMVEYAILVALISVIAIVAIGLLGGRINVIFGDVYTAMGGAAGE